MKTRRYERNDTVLGKKVRMVGGRVSLELYDAIKACVGPDQYRSMNDVVEFALLEFVHKNARNEGGINSGM